VSKSWPRCQRPAGFSALAPRRAALDELEAELADKPERIKGRLEELDRLTSARSA